MESCSRSCNSLQLRLDEEKQRNDQNGSVDFESFETLASNLALVWNNPQTDVRVKKRIARTLIEEIVVDIDESAGVIDLLIHWKGALHSNTQVRRRKRGKNSLHTDTSVVEAVRVLSNVLSDELIAAVVALLLGTACR